MKLFAPEYYKSFACIADMCEHSCCVGWEIDVDDASLKKYESLRDDYGKKVRESITTDNGVAHFKLCEGERCPHLDERGLCRMITNLGMDSLCDICREHPRFYNVIGDRCEVGVGAACEAAAKLILDSDEYDMFINVGEYTDPCQEAEEPSVFLDPSGKGSPRATRDEIYKILKDDSQTYEARLRRIYSEAGISPEKFSNKSWRSVINELEYLSEDTRSRFSVFSKSIYRAKDTERAASRFLAYLIYRHTSSARTKTELKLSLGFAFFAERLFVSLIRSEGAEMRYELARLISEEIEYSEDNVESIKLEFL